MLPRGGAAEADAGHLDMQLTSKVVLSAAALLLATAAYRLYRWRLAQAPPGGGDTKADAQEETEGSGQPAVQGASPGTRQSRLRRRRSSAGARGSLGCSWEKPGGACVLASGAPPRDEKPPRKGSGAEQGGQSPDSEQAPLPSCGLKAGAAVGGKPDPPESLCLCTEPQSSAAGLPGAGAGSGVGGEPAPWPDGGPPKPRPGELEAPIEGSSDMNQSQVFTPVPGASREEAGALQAASDTALALHRQDGATNTSYTFSSVARVRMEENFIPKAEGRAPALKGKVYDYYVESTSQAVSSPAPSTASRAEAPSPEDTAPGAGTGGSPQPALSPSAGGFSRKESLLQIAENPELQLQLDSFGPPAPAPQARGSLPGSAASSGEPQVQLVAGTNFLRVPLGPASSGSLCLDLGNCFEVLALAKRQNLESLKEAAYKVMSDNYLHVLRSPDIYGRLSGAERELILRRRLAGRRHLVVADVCPQEGCGHLCCYDDAQDAWHPLAQLPPEAVSWGCAVCTLFNYLFVVSGCQGPGRQPSSRVFCYNPLTGIWSEVCPLSQARPHCRLVALDGHLYAIGGECLNTVEHYDPRLDRWTFAPPLPNDTFALAHTATACGDEIFVTGGTLRYLLLRFSAREQRWWAGPTGGSKDRTTEMVAVNGFLYRFDLNCSLGIGVYRCSASTRLWYECASLDTRYPDPFQCAVVDNRVYCVGRQRTLCFLADHISPRFVPKELQSFPSPKGTLLPTVLTLPASGMPQTRV